MTGPRSPRGRADLLGSRTSLTPREARGLPLLLLERDASTPEGSGTQAVLDIGVGDPGVIVDSVPDCGCDACDSGSLGTPSLSSANPG